MVDRWQLVSGAISVPPGAVALAQVGFTVTTTTVGLVRVLAAGKF